MGRGGKRDWQTGKGVGRKEGERRRKAYSVGAEERDGQGVKRRRKRFGRGNTIN